MSGSGTEETSRQAPTGGAGGPVQVRRGRTTATNLARGGLIGAAEAVPGLSGGTVALVTGVYETMINSAGHLLSGLRALVTDRARARAEFAQVRWDVLLPLAAGMVPVLVVALLLLAPAIEAHPVPMRALLFGMVAAALVVPAGMVGRWRPADIPLVVLAAAAAFVLTGELRAELDPSLPVVFITAAIAVCALVLPGVSGAFLLLAFGVYAPAREAVRELDLAYIGVFILGALCGLAGFVKVLQWLLTRHHRVTLVVMTGLIAGALRALWPWQTADEALLAPAGQVPLALLLGVLGAGIVLGIVAIERRQQRDPSGLPVR